MRAVAQRVSSARVEVGGEVVGAIGRGLLVYLGAAPEDDEATVGTMVNKIAGLRIFEDDEGRMSRSVQDIGGEVLVVPQFTLFGDVRRGRRPSFEKAAHRNAEPLFLSGPNPTLAVREKLSWRRDIPVLGGKRA